MKKFILWCFVGISAYLLQRFFFTNSYNDKKISIENKKSIIDYYQNVLSLIKQEDKNCKIGIGYTIDEDVSVNAVKLMKELGFTKFPENARYIKKINTLDEFVEAFGYSFEKGSSIELVVENKTLFKDIVQAARRITQDIGPGGNGFFFGLRTTLENCDWVLFGIPLNSKYKDQFFNRQINLTRNLEEIEDIHLVLNFFTNEPFGSVLTPRSNRMYFQSDVLNPVLAYLEDFHKKANEQMLDLLCLGGQFLMENIDNTTLKNERLNKMEEVIKDSNKISRIHVEMGSFQSEEFFIKFLDKILSQIDSIGLNEQELYMFDSILKGESFVGLIEGKISVNELLMLKINVLKRFMARGFRLNRLHFHTINFHSLCSTDVWDKPEISLIKGIITGMQTSKNPDIAENIQDYDFDFSQLGTSFPENLILSTFNEEPILKKFDINNPVQCWNASPEFQCCVAPMFFWLKPGKTRGLGDSLSSSGLIYHKIKKSPRN